MLGEQVLINPVYSFTEEMSIQDKIQHDFLLRVPTDGEKCNLRVINIYLYLNIEQYCPQTVQNED